MTTENSAPKTPYVHPWKGAPDGVAADLALADLVNNLPRKLTVDGRTHAETLLAASGAIAGYTAQRSLMFRMTAEEIVDPSSGIQILQSTAGGLFFFGEPLDQALVALSPVDHHKLWPLAGSAAIEAGLDPNDLPPLTPMFDHVASTLGSPREGTTSIEGVRFQAATFALLRTVWPLAMTCFNGQLSGQQLNPPVVVTPPWRPVIAALAAGRMIRDTASVLPPRKALTIVMETAIYASKLSPSIVEPQTAPVSA
ncbi:MAG TPA: hypothetical protein VGM25_01765 [Caulobacteraceae bacterium]|jgi:hypothetical protein